MCRRRPPEPRRRRAPCWQFDREEEHMSEVPPSDLAWQAVHRDGDAIIPEGWKHLRVDEREEFRDELEEWVSKARAQPQLFADHGARARRLLQLTQDRP